MPIHTDTEITEEHSTTSVLPPPPPPLFLPFKPPTFIPKPPPVYSKAESVFRHLEHFFPDNHMAVVYVCQTLQPVIQEGPCCGIVALAMAGQIISADVLSSDVILAMAKAQKYTKNGEIFSATHMAKLASSLFNCKTTVLEEISLYQDVILKHICHGLPVLFPYDADKNHSPCLNEGRNAHWAVICGMCFSLPDVNHILNEKDFSVTDYPCIFEATSAVTMGNLMHLGSKVSLFAYQGKSKYMSCWRFEELVESNLNLRKLTDKYPLSEMEIENPGDPLSELRNKAILLSSCDK